MNEPEAHEVEALAAWGLDDREVVSVHEAMVDAGAWQLLELTMDTSDRSPSPEDVEQARTDIRAMLTHRDAALVAQAKAEACEQVAQAIEDERDRRWTFDEVRETSPNQILTRAARIARAEGATS